MPWMLQPHNYTQTLRPNFYNIAYGRVGTYKGMGLITSSNFFVPQVNQPGSMATFVVPAQVANPNATRGLGAVHRYWRIGRGGLGQGDALAQAQDAARANYANTMRYAPATWQMLLSRTNRRARGLGQQVGPLYTCPTGEQVYRTVDCPGGQPAPDVQQQLADIWSQITTGTTQPAAAPSTTLTQWLPWIAIGALGLIVIARR